MGGIMMETINIRMDKNLKVDFEKFCQDMGMSMTTAFTVFAKKVVSEERIPFEIGRKRMNPETQEALDEVRWMKAHPNMTKSYSDVNEMMKDLLK